MDNPDERDCRNVIVSRSTLTHLSNPMMAPAAQSASAPAKAGVFDIASIFVADKAARDEAQVALATATKQNGVQFLGQIGYVDATLKVSCIKWIGDDLNFGARVTNTALGPFQQEERRGP